MHAALSRLLHEQYMREALGLAVRGQGWVSPNPMVGAVIVKRGKIIGRGWHKLFGGPHAEIFALREAGAQSAGATLYCTLEPCNHTGKTPPCVEAILKAGIQTVVLGARDPNSVASGGVKTLESGGVTVITDICELECRRLNAPFFKRVQTGMPFVSLKWAMSADGKIATASGDSKWITGEKAREFGHVLRSRHDAVLIGINTLLADAARLNCRLTQTQTQNGAGCKQPRRVILDSRARTPMDAPLWSVADAGAVIVICNNTVPKRRLAALRARGAELVVLKAKKNRLPLTGVLEALIAQGILSVLVEGGSTILGAFVDERLADAAYAFIAPKIIGGRNAISAVGGEGVANVAAGLSLITPKVELLGEDVLMSGALSKWGE